MRLHHRFPSEEAQKVSFRCSAAELAEYNALAAGMWGNSVMGVSLSRWVRHVLNSFVKGEQIQLQKKAEKEAARQSSGKKSGPKPRARKKVSNEN